VFAPGSKKRLFSGASTWAEKIITPASTNPGLRLGYRHVFHSSTFPKAHTNINLKNGNTEVATLHALRLRLYDISDIFNQTSSYLQSEKWVWPHITTKIAASLTRCFRQWAVLVGWSIDYLQIFFKRKTRLNKHINRVSDQTTDSLLLKPKTSATTIPKPIIGHDHVRQFYASHIPKSVYLSSY
jgi:hypothetical protein